MMADTLLMMKEILKLILRMIMISECECYLLMIRHKVKKSIYIDDEHNDHDRNATNDDKYEYCDRSLKKNSNDKDSAVLNIKLQIILR